MTEFASIHSYSQFAASVARQWRYLQHEQADFIAAVRATCHSRAEAVPKGMNVYRAQEGHDWRDGGTDGEQIEVPSAFSPTRMRPFPDKAREGRANARGIPCLYVATHHETAIAEVRPWIGSFVSVALFEIVRDLKVVNVTTDNRSNLIFAVEPPADVRERQNWAAIGRAFSRPVTADDFIADYAPTQILAEVIRSEGFDGIAYGSSLGPGHNLALFDLDCAILTGGQLMSIDGIQFRSNQADNPYSVARTGDARET